MERLSSVAEMAQTKEEKSAKNREWYQAHKDYFRDYWRVHKDRKCQLRKESRARHLETQRAWGKKYRGEIKRRAFVAVGGVVIECATCGESRMACLSIDHIKGNGRRDLRLKGLEGGHRFYLWLLEQSDLSGYQVLCMNCQWVKREANKEVLRGEEHPSSKPRP